MRIEFTEKFESVAEKLLNITRKDVIRTVTNPLRKQTIDMDGLKVMLFLQKEHRPNTYLLVMGQCTGNVLIVSNDCFRLLPELISKVGNEEPIVLLQQLAFNFGVPMKFGDRVGKFFFRELIRVPKGVKTELFEAKAEPNSHVIVSMFTREGTLMNQKEVGIIECAIIFSIEMNSYIAWLNSKATVQVSAQTYDIFIAYKRRTGKSFAQYLKGCLTEEGYRAFLDTTDIPKEFEGTEKWFEVRDEAIRNSKRFLLIITIAIESAEEVAKELVLARSVPNMKFIYARHDVLKPQIQIGFKNEIIDLGEGNQVPFSTDDDLARKVLQILQDNDRVQTLE